MRMIAKSRPKSKACRSPPTIEERRQKKKQKKKAKKRQEKRDGRAGCVRDESDDEMNGEIGNMFNV